MSFERTKQREKAVLISSSLPFSLRLPRGNKIALLPRNGSPFVLAMIERSISLVFVAVAGCVQKNFFVVVVVVVAVVDVLAFHGLKSDAEIIDSSSVRLQWA